MQERNKKESSVELFNRVVNFGVDQKLPYLELRKARLMNVIIYSVSVFLLLFIGINIIIGNYFLAISDFLMLFIVCLPSLILQYKKFYKANYLLVTFAFLVLTTALTIVEHDGNRQTEHILIPIAIMPIFLFEGWKRNVMFLLFPLCFFLIRFVAMYRAIGHIEFHALHAIYTTSFLSVYVLASYFKKDMIKFYEQLKESNIIKDKLFRIISHDIRNPFSSLLGSSDLQMKYLQTGETEKLEKTSIIINSASKKIYALTQTLLDWSQTQTGTFVVRRELLDLNELIKQVVDFCSLTSRAKDIFIHFSPSTSYKLQCDSIMTQIALRNVIMNAVKFSHRNSEVFISISQNESFICIKVSDKGVGISHERLNTLFDESKIESEFGTEKEKGSGLGLIISKELIEKQDGKIKVTSTEGKGSEFVLSLPINH